MSIISTRPSERQSARDLNLHDARDRQFVALVRLDALIQRCGGRLVPAVPLRQELAERSRQVMPEILAAIGLLQGQEAGS
ncbi:MAG TPA: hypothetical protein VHR66_33135 [Gemmataceae bacterium]|nr:hypothetical protein [Gemmataceae bacterium]